MKQNFVHEIKHLLEEIPAEQWQDPSICGVRYELLPWHRMSSVTIQIREDDVHDPGGWNYYYSAESDVTRIQKELAEYLERPDRLLYHKFLLEAAEAMLSIDFGKYGQPNTVEKGCLYEPFQLQVYDADRTFRFNYCEYILARRLDVT